MGVIHSLFIATTILPAKIKIKAAPSATAPLRSTPSSSFR